MNTDFLPSRDPLIGVVTKLDHDLNAERRTEALTEKKNGRTYGKTPVYRFAKYLTCAQSVPFRSSETTPLNSVSTSRRNRSGQLKMVTYFIRNLIPRRDKNEDQPRLTLLQALASLTPVQILQVLCGWLAWTSDAVGFFTVSLSVTALEEKFNKSTHDIVSPREGNIPKRT